MEIVKNGTSAEPLKKEKETVASVAEKKKKPVEPSQKQPTSDGSNAAVADSAGPGTGPCSWKI